MERREAIPKKRKGNGKMESVTTLDETVIEEIGHAFGYYDYAGEQGLASAFPSREATATYICGYVRMALKAGMLYTIGENQEAFIAYKLPGQKVGLKAGLPLLKGFFSAMRPKEAFRFFRIMIKGGPGLDDRMKKAQKPYLFVGMVCVREPYQGQGYMRKAMELAFSEGNRLGVPVILDTDAKSKCDKYIHLGMELAGTRRFGEYGLLYDLIKNPDCK